MPGTPERRAGLILYLQNLAKELGFTPGERDLPAQGPTHRVFVYIFGSWRKAQIAAGLTPNPRGWNGHRDVRLHLDEDTSHAA
ncbi:MAG: hypothetical protein JWN50_612 [Parcubacteria group bacterium]|nr:hypothetical protein [Parcubacteria group bacterium]